MFLFFLFLFFLFIVGGSMTLVGFISKTQKYFIKKGLIICSIAIGLVVIPLVFTSIFNSFKYKPTSIDLVGEYQITEVTNLDFDKATYNQYKLVLKSDSTFTLTPTPNIEVCESGTYELDYSNEGNELSYRCGKGNVAGQIDKRFKDFRIEFIVGDPDSRQSIFFGKINAKK